MVNWKPLAGYRDYDETLVLMENTLQNVINKKQNETIFLLEHKDVYTAGTSYTKEELLNNYDIPVVYTGRGGKFTYHGPGQRVIYPILNLNLPNRKKDIRLYIQMLEQWIINSLEAISIKAYVIEDKVGIWVNVNNKPAKIGAIGVRVKKWVTYHGIAVNISTNLDKYKGIIPCGIDEFPVTSIEEMGIKISMTDFDSLLKQEFNKLFNENN